MTALRWARTRITRAFTTRGWHRLRRDYERDHAPIDAMKALHQTRPDRRIRVRKRDHLPGLDQPQPTTWHDVWLERDSRRWWRRRWCWWLGCQQRHGYRLTRRAAARRLMSELADHRCTGKPAPTTGRTT